MSANSFPTGNDNEDVNKNKIIYSGSPNIIACP